MMHKRVLTGPRGWKQTWIRSLVGSKLTLFRSRAERSVSPCSHQNVFKFAAMTQGGAKELTRRSDFTLQSNVCMQTVLFSVTDNQTSVTCCF